jgi:hypothetical protein
VAFQLESLASTEQGLIPQSRLTVAHGATIGTPRLPSVRVLLLVTECSELRK